MESIWTAETEIRKREPLAEDLETQAVVIGAGLAGMLTAYYLEQAGIQAVVLEADRIGSGQTKNTTAKITSQHGLVYDRLIRTFGHSMAKHYAQANEAAIEEYERLVLELGIDCDFVRCPAYLYSQEETVLLKRETEAAKRLGIIASFDTRSELPFPVAGVTKFEGQARFQPLKFLEKLGERVTVHEQTKALKVEGNQVITDRGRITAKHIVFAAHFPFANMPGYYFARMYQERSYVVALEGAGALEGMYLGIDPGGLSFRPQGELLLLGGGSHRTGLNKGGGKYEMLRSKAADLYPDCRESASWSAQDCVTLDGIPYIGCFSRREPEWYVATGFGKWGMTSSMVSARVLTALIAGKDCPEADIFSPKRRFTMQAAKELAIHSGHTVKGLAKHILPAGTGEVIPNCPHMGCRLEWNMDEDSYDCPCHGSRFDKKGRLLDGPAQTDCQRRKGAAQR
ncbi:MAG: FAD-dependent oxidoreductase [Firmicutes bacterium]|jgi:glycine/D-amino acid oxidase-like deaminating enzyme|nr:FAD-dependent oxidoreductase [Bacillota bacterium]NBI61635.1 FAD-dependent oxidoreductase [Clostridiales bacterium]